MADTVILDIAGSDLDRAWDDYVALWAPSACLTTGWRDVLVESLGHRPRYLVARSGGTVQGVLPLFEMRNRLFGNRLVSLPFVDCGGVVANSADVEGALIEAAIRAAHECGAERVEIRQQSAFQAENGGSWWLMRHKARLIVALRGDSGMHWADLSSRLRGKIRKAERSGAVFSLGGAELLGQFYRVFCKNMRDLGTPVHALSLFENAFRRCNGCQIMLVTLAGRPVAAAFAVRREGTIELPWICSDYDYRTAYVNEFLYWRAIEAACLAKCERLDLGRSSVGAGTYKFKKQWNPQELPLFWYNWVAPNDNSTDLSPHNPGFALAIACWKRLPVTVANRLGPHLARHLP